MVVGVAIDRDPAAAEMDERGFLPVVGVVQATASSSWLAGWLARRFVFLRAEVAAASGVLVMQVATARIILVLCVTRVTAAFPLTANGMF